MDWWIWLLGGLALLVIEMATPGGLFFLFFGVASLLVGALAGLGIAPDWLQFLVFSVLSVGSLLVFRGPLLRRMRASTPTAKVDDIASEIAVLVDDLPPHTVGKAELRGTVWNVQSLVEQVLPKGQRCAIDRVEGLKLWVRPI